MEKKNKIELIKTIIEKLNNLSSFDFNELDKILKESNLIVKKIFGINSHYLEEINSISFKTQWIEAVKEIHIGAWDKGKNKLINTLDIMIKDLELNIGKSDINSNSIIKPDPWQENKILYIIISIIIGLGILIIWECIKNYFIT